MYYMSRERRSQGFWQKNSSGKSHYNNVRARVGGRSDDSLARDDLVEEFGIGRQGLVETHGQASNGLLCEVQVEGRRDGVEDFVKEGVALLSMGGGGVEVDGGLAVVGLAEVGLGAIGDEGILDAHDVDEGLGHGVLQKERTPPACRRATTRGVRARASRGWLQW
jgi:hypothetical protein